MQCSWRFTAMNGRPQPGRLHVRSDMAGTDLLLLGRYDNYSEIFDRTAAKRERIAPRVPAAPWISLDELSKELKG